MSPSPSAEAESYEVIHHEGTKCQKTVWTNGETSGSEDGG